MLFFVTLSFADEPPVAEAGIGVLAYVGDTVVLNGTASVDPEGATLSYRWSQVGGPPVDIASGLSAQPSFEIGEPGTYRFELIVNDGLADSDPDRTEVVVPYTAVEGEVDGGCAVRPGRAFGAALLAAGLLWGRRRT